MNKPGMVSMPVILATREGRGRRIKVWDWPEQKGETLSKKLRSKRLEHGSSGRVLGVRLWVQSLVPLKNNK
jgi:hypothetical protein